MPQEIIVYMAYNLSAKDLVMFASTSTQYTHLMDDSMIWRLRLSRELGISEHNQPKNVNAHIYSDVLTVDSCSTVITRHIDLNCVFYGAPAIIELIQPLAMSITDFIDKYIQEPRFVLTVTSCVVRQLIHKPWNRSSLSVQGYIGHKIATLLMKSDMELVATLYASLSLIERIPHWENQLTCGSYPLHELFIGIAHSMIKYHVVGTRIETVNDAQYASLCAKLQKYKDKINHVAMSRITMSERA